MEDLPEMSNAQLESWFRTLHALIAAKYGNLVSEGFAQQVQTAIVQQSEALPKELGNNARFDISRAQTKQRFPQEWSALLSAAGKRQQQVPQK